MSYKKINVGKLMERKILACARRTVGSLFYPNLIRMSCEEEDVPRFDQYKEDFVLDPKVFLSFDEEVKENEEKKKKEEEKEADKKNVAEEVPQNNSKLLLLQQHILKQEAVWVFVKAAHEWYTQGFGATILPPPVFPDWVLSDVGPSGHAQDKPEVPKSPPTAKKKNTPGAAKSMTAPPKRLSYLTVMTVMSH